MIAKIYLVLCSVVSAYDVNYPTTRPKGYCEAECLKTPACASMVPAQGSYCKFWNNPPVCFGLYRKGGIPNAMCYVPNDPKCDDSPGRPPVRC